MKKMTKDRFFSMNVECAAVLLVNRGYVKIMHGIYKDRYCPRLQAVYMNDEAERILQAVKSRSTEYDEEYPGDLKKKLVTQTGPMGGMDLWHSFTDCLEMNSGEFADFVRSAQGGMYLVAFREKWETQTESGTTYEMPVQLKSMSVIRRCVYDMDGREAVVEEPFDFYSSGDRKAMFMLMVSDPLDGKLIEDMKAELDAVVEEIKAELPFL